MGGFFGVVSKHDAISDVFFGTDYHSHLGTRRAGMAVYSKENGFDKAIHSIENTQFRTKFTGESNTMHGNYGIGCIFVPTYRFCGNKTYLLCRNRGIFPYNFHYLCFAVKKLFFHNKPSADYFYSLYYRNSLILSIAKD